MRIAHIVPDFRETLRHYDSAEPEFHASVRALLSGFAQCPMAEVHILSCLQRPVRSPDRLFPNVRFHALHVPKIGWLRTGYQGCVRAVRRALREIGPDVVHGQGTERYGALSAALSGFPNVITVRGNMRRVARAMNARRFGYFGLTALLETLTIPRAGGVVCISRYAREQVAGLNPRTWLIPNAVEDEFFSLRNEPREPLLVCASDIVEYKNQAGLMRALDALRGRMDFSLLFAGRIDRETGYAREFRREVAARPWCRYEGHADRERVKALLQSALIVVHPSREDNSPMTVMEAMAAGVPVAASRIGGIPDLIDDGVTGLLFDPDRPDTVASTLERLLSDAALRRDLARAGRARAEADFRPRRVAEQHLAVYREIAG